MKIRYLLIILLSLTYFYSHAQSYTVKGVVADTLNANTLQNASVILTRASDSVLVDFARTKADGSFELHPKEAGKYNIMITFPGFADFIDVVKVTTTTPVDLARISMISRNHLLSEFVLKQQIGAIKIKGDTTEYVADSFKVKDNATVEELLKRLPGLQVNKNGEVVAQGEKVEKILVDGEEFFSDDPAVVIKNLQANAIDKVQVFDKKSDQATFTGIDDGQKTKTINLQLKEDKKKGYFGKVNVGGGTDGYFENQAMINAFKGKRQISVFGITSNTGQVGLGWQDKDKFGSGNGTTTINDDGGIITTFTNTNDDPFQSWDGKYNGQGLPTVWTGGVHYADKWNEDKEHLTSNYRFAQQNVEIGGTTVSQNPLLNSGYLNREHKDQFSTGIRHNVDGMLEWKLDSLSTLKLSVDAGYRDSKTRSAYTTDVLSTEKDTLSHALRNITNDGTTQKLNADLIYRKKFEKKGRTLSIDVKENYQDSKTTGHLFSNTVLNLFDTSRNLLGSKDSIVNQQKTNNSTRLAFSGKATYTEPLSKVAFLELNYGASVNNSKTDKGSYDTSASGKNDVLNPIYSSNYAFNIFTNTAGSTLRFVYKKINFSFGGDVSNSAYKQTNVAVDTSYSYNYVNFYPRATFNYKMDKTRNFTFNYAGSTKQPTIDQIQPLKDNTDPMNIAVGNTKLKQEFDNSLTVRFNDFKILTNRYLWASASVNFANDAITRSDTVGVFGNRKYSYVNTDGNYFGWAYVGYGFKLTKIDLQMGIHANVNVNHIKSFITSPDISGTMRTAANISDNNSYTVGMEFNYYKDKKYSISFEPSATYNNNKSNITTYTTDYWSSTNTLEGSVELPMKFEVGTTFEWFLRQKTAVFDRNNNVMLWKAYVSKKFMKNSQLELRAYVFDILKQNLGYDRVVNNGITTESTYNTIGQFGILRLIWNFTKTPGGAPPAEGGMMMMRR